MTQHQLTMSLNYYTHITPLVGVLAAIKINPFLVLFMALQSQKKSIRSLKLIFLLSKGREKSSKQIPQTTEVFPRTKKVQI